MSKSVAEICTEQQVTVDELVRRTQLLHDRVLAIVMGRWTPSPDERQRIGAALGVPPRDISWGHKTPIQHIYGHGPG